MKLLCTAPLILAAGLTASALAQPYYTVRDLGSVSGTGETWVFAINAAGQGAGYSQYNPVPRLCTAVRTGAGAPVNLGRLSGGIHSYGWGINNAGQVAGMSENASRTLRPVFHNGTSWVVLPSIAATPGLGAALAINNTGIAVGASGTSENLGGQIIMHASRWVLNPTPTVTDLGTLGGKVSHAFGVNDAGQIVGAAMIANGPFHAFLWQAGVMTDLGTLGGAASEARDINSAGQIVGWADTPALGRRAFLWQGGVMSEVGTLGTSSEARAINTGGTIVGTSWVAGAGPRAFVRSAGGAVLDLNARVAAPGGWVFQYACDVNDGGTVIGYGRVAGKTRSFLLTPIACRPDINGDGFVDGKDYDLFSGAFESGGATADYNGDGFVDGIDYDLFNNDFENGC